MVVGWFVCERCALVAVCPGCVPVVPAGVVQVWCPEHETLCDGKGVVMLSQEEQSGSFC
jgi:hypothetical protein